LVIVVGDAAGIREMVAPAPTDDAGGVRPRVIGMLVAVPPPGLEGQPAQPSRRHVLRRGGVEGGRPDRRAGRRGHIKGAAGYQISQAAGIEAGQTKPTAIAFVASDGTMALASTDAATDDKLRELIDTLQ
jgi:hypothetical protein